MKKFLKIFLFLILLSGIISVFLLKEDIKKLPIFYLNKIILSKIEHYDETKIIKLITPEEKTSVFKVDIDEIKQRLSSDYTFEKFRDEMYEEDETYTELNNQKNDIESLFEK